MSMHPEDAQRFIRNGLIVRYHNEPEMPKQTIAEHVYNMGCILTAWCPDAPADVWRIIHFHDNPEEWTGDLPAPLKWNNPKIEQEIRDIEGRYWQEYGPPHGFDSHDEWLCIIKAIDILELLWYCLKHQGRNSGIVRKIESAIEHRMNKGPMEIGRWPTRDVFNYSSATKSNAPKMKSGHVPGFYRPIVF